MQGWRKRKELSLRWSQHTWKPRLSSYCPEKSKAGCGGSCSESIPATGVLTGVPTGVPMQGCRVVSAPVKVFS